MQWVLKGEKVLRRVLRRGSKKRLSRRHLEGRKHAFLEYGLVGVHISDYIPLENRFPEIQAIMATRAVEQC